MAEHEGVESGKLSGGNKFTSEENEIVLMKLSKKTTDLTATAYRVNAISYKQGDPLHVDDNCIVKPIEFKDDSIVFTESE